MSTVEQVAAGLLVDAIAATGRQISVALVNSQGRKTRENVDIATWFNTYALVDRALPDMPPNVNESQLADKLRTNEIQALIQEVLAARLSDAPEGTVQRIKQTFVHICGSDYSADIFDHIDEHIADLVVAISTTKPSIVQSIRTTAHFTRINATLEAIERHLASLSRQYDPVTDSEYVSRYRNHVKDHHGMIEPPDLERRRRVPIDSLYVSPMVREIVAAGDKDEAHRPADLFKDSEIDRTVLSGDPGGGKTTASHAFLYRHALDASLRTPFLITLREFAADDPPQW